MELTVLGFKINVLNALIFLALGFLIATMTVASCAKVSIKETFVNLHNAAVLGVNNNADIMDSWTSKAQQYAGNIGNEDHVKHGSKYDVPAEKEKLFYLGKNEFKPECCPSTYSSSTGCACVSEEQMSYLNQRGGNRTSQPTEF